MKKITYNLLLILSIWAISINTIYAQARKGVTVQRQYARLMPVTEGADYPKVPVYSDVRVGHEKIAYFIYHKGVYQIDVEKNLYAPNQSYYKLYDIDGKYLGWIPFIYVKQCSKPKVPTDIEMVHVDGGTYDMGDNTDPDASPVHKVTVSDFDIMKYEITLEQWKSIMGAAHTSISWYDVQEFIKILNKYSGKKYRLPTEAEWEYAARGGKNSKGFKYSGSNSIKMVAVCKWNSKDKLGKYTRHAVGLLAPNELGLYDMSGNMREFCSDKYELYPETAQTNPHIPVTGKEPMVVLRGGGWTDDDLCKTTKRNYHGAMPSGDEFGFRLVLDCTNKAHKATTKKPVDANSLPLFQNVVEE